MDNTDLQRLAHKFVRELVDTSIERLHPVRQFLRRHTQFETLSYEEKIHLIDVFEDAIRRLV
jgi:hypothetical protein